MISRSASPETHRLNHFERSEISWLRTLDHNGWKNQLMVNTLDLWIKLGIFALERT